MSGTIRSRNSPHSCLDLQIILCFIFTISLVIFGNLCKFLMQIFSCGLMTIQTSSFLLCICCSLLGRSFFLACDPLANAVGKSSNAHKSKRELSSLSSQHIVQVSSARMPLNSERKKYKVKLYVVCRPLKYTKEFVYLNLSWITSKYLNTCFLYRKVYVILQYGSKFWKVVSQ